jgi:large subunit ribosomal protein L4
MKVDIYNSKGQPTGRQAELSDDIFAVSPNEHVVYLAVKQYLAGKRSGTHATKEKSTLSGSTRKLHKQKGTGGSRKGSIKNPLFRGGARIFGPQPRDYSFKLNKKVKAIAKKSVLSTKLAANAIKVVEDFTFEVPKTKAYLEVLHNFGLSGKKSLYIANEVSDNVYLSCRNVQGADISAVEGLNVYDILNASTVLISEKSIELIHQQLA